MSPVSSIINNNNNNNHTTYNRRGKNKPIYINNNAERQIVIDCSLY
jgi:hypothetical protein